MGDKKVERLNAAIEKIDKKGVQNATRADWDERKAASDAIVRGR